MKNIDLLISKYASLDSISEALDHAFTQGEYVYAGDEHTIIRARKDVCSNEYPEQSTPKCSSVFPNNKKEIIINISFFRDAKKQVPLVDEMKMCGEDIECSECKGEGTVEWDYKHWSEEFDCPACKGSGYSKEKRLMPTGNKIQDPIHGIAINEIGFRWEYLSMVFEAMNLFNMEEIIMKYNNATSGALFCMCDGVDILLMPTIIAR